MIQNNTINLYIIASPIGNINEVTFNTIDILKKSEIIVCESPLRTKKIFYKYQIDMNKKFLKCNKDTEELAFLTVKKVLNKISKKIITISLVSNAGYPLISDPGWYFLKKLKENFLLNTFVSNGPCSINHALVLSGFKINSFFFFGFLPKKISDFQKKVQKIKELPTLIVFFLSKHRLKKELEKLLIYFPLNNVSLAFELSKINERIINGTLSDLINKVSDHEKGEIILTIDNN